MSSDDIRASQAAARRYFTGGIVPQVEPGMGATAMGAGAEAAMAAVGAGACAQNPVSAAASGMLGRFGGGWCTAQPCVDELLSMGSCTLALARARGVLAPWVLTTEGDFVTNTSAGAQLTDLNPSNNDRLITDAYVRGAEYKILNTQTANAPPSQSVNDFFFNQQSGINVRMRVQGNPGSNPIPYYTPITALPATLCGGWIMRRTEWPQFDLLATIDLPNTVSVFISLALWAPRMQDGDLYRSNCEAARALKCEFGIDLGV